MWQAHGGKADAALRTIPCGSGNGPLVSLFTFIFVFVVQAA